MMCDWGRCWRLASVSIAVVGGTLDYCSSHAFPALKTWPQRRERELESQNRVVTQLREAS